VSRDRLAVAALAAILTVAAPELARAHERSVSYSEVRIDGAEARVRARITRLDLSRLPLDPLAEASVDDAVARYLASHLTLARGGAPCAPKGSPHGLSAPDGWAVYEWTASCPGVGAFELESRLFSEVAPSHLHFARVELPPGTVQERVLSDDERRWSLGDGTSPNPPAQSGTSFAGYVALGVEHILSGWDHLAFVAALLLLATSLREVTGLITAFTIAHSITLALATLGLVRPLGPQVDALIGFSIALVAAENAWLLGGRDRWIPGVLGALLAIFVGLAVLGVGALSPLALLGLGLFGICHFALLDRVDRPERWRAAVAFGFGLVHGFGFAGMLVQLDLPRPRLVPALLGFNVGVELGQLAVVTVLWPSLRGLGRLGGGAPARVLAEVGSAAVCGLGVYWFLTRTFG
jgi:hypothetical protein